MKRPFANVRPVGPLIVASENLDSAKTPNQIADEVKDRLPDIGDRTIDTLYYSKQEFGKTLREEADIEQPFEISADDYVDESVIAAFYSNKIPDTPSTIAASVYYNTMLLFGEKISHEEAADVFGISVNPIQNHSTDISDLTTELIQKEHETSNSAKEIARNL